MGVAKNKFEFLFKITLILVFFIFFIFDFLNRDLSSNLPDISKNSSYSITVTGGSNAMYGLNASEIKEKLGDSINLSLPAEGLIFSNYIAWLTQLNIKTHAVIYSPVSFWDVKELDTQDPSLIRKIHEIFPKISLLRFLMNFATQTSFTPRRSSDGDLIEFKCTDTVFKWKASNEYIKRALIAATHFKQRMEAIGKATKADIVILRIPPLLVSNSDKEIIEPKIQEVMAFYRSQGMLVLQDNIILSSDQSLFCDHAYHPSQIGRAVFTENLIANLKKIL